MKNIPRTVKAAGAIILGILLVPACVHPIAESSKPVVVEWTGVQVKDPGTFCDHMKARVSKDATYGFVIVQVGKDPQLCCQPTDCSASKLILKVDKVTKSAAAETSAGNSPHWGSHVTQRLASPDPRDFTALANELP